MLYEVITIHLEYLGGNSLRCDILIEEWTDGDIIRALVLAKAFSKVASQLAIDAREGVPHVRNEITGLLNAAFELYWEEAGGAPQSSSSPAPRVAEQGSLFGE